MDPHPFLSRNDGRKLRSPLRGPGMSQPSSFIEKAFWALRARPAQVLGALRGMILFYWSRMLLKVLPPAGVVLGKNVRLQKYRSIMAEQPNARIILEDDSIIYENAKIEAYGSGRIQVSSQSVLGDLRIVSRYGITIGKRFLSSWNVFIEDYDQHPTDAALRALQVADIVEGFRPRFETSPAEKIGTQWRSKNWSFPGEPIIIGDDVWVCAGATILKGARIGNGCIVASGAVVRRGEYPPNSVLAGSPAKVVKTLGGS